MRHRPLISKKAAIDVIAPVDAASAAYHAAVDSKPMDLESVNKAKEAFHASLCHMYGALQYYAGRSLTETR